MKSKRFGLITLGMSIVLATTSCTIWSEKKHPGWKSATSGEQVVNLFWGDVKAKDWKTVDAHVAGTFISLNEIGTGNREKLMELLRSVDLQEFQIGEVETRSAGTDLIVTYTIAAKGTANGQPLSLRMRMMSVWQELKHGWVLVAQSAVPAGQ